MFDRLGVTGVLGVLLALAGVGLIASQDLLIAAGLALVLVGFGLIVKGLISGVLSAWGMV